MAGQPQIIEPQTAATRADRLRPPVNEWDGRMRSYIPGPTAARVRQPQAAHRRGRLDSPGHVRSHSQRAVDRQPGAGRYHPQGLLVAGDHLCLRLQYLDSERSRRRRGVRALPPVLPRDGGPGRAVDDREPERVPRHPRRRPLRPERPPDRRQPSDGLPGVRPGVRGRRVVLLDFQFDSRPRHRRSSSGQLLRRRARHLQRGHADTAR